MPFTSFCWRTASNSCQFRGKPWNVHNSSFPHSSSCTALVICRNLACQRRSLRIQDDRCKPFLPPPMCGLTPTRQMDSAVYCAAIVDCVCHRLLARAIEESDSLAPSAGRARQGYITTRHIQLAMRRDAGLRVLVSTNASLRATATHYLDHVTASMLNGPEGFGAAGVLQHAARIELEALKSTHEALETKCTNAVTTMGDGKMASAVEFAAAGHTAVVHPVTPTAVRAGEMDKGVPRSTEFSDGNEASHSRTGTKRMTPLSHCDEVTEVDMILLLRAVHPMYTLAPEARATMVAVARSILADIITLINRVDCAVDDISVSASAAQLAARTLCFKDVAILLSDWLPSREQELAARADQDSAGQAGALRRGAATSSRSIGDFHPPSLRRLDSVRSVSSAAFSPRTSMVTKGYQLGDGSNEAAYVGLKQQVTAFASSALARYRLEWTADTRQRLRVVFPRSGPAPVSASHVRYYRIDRRESLASVLSRACKSLSVKSDQIVAVYRGRRIPLDGASPALLMPDALGLQNGEATVFYVPSKWWSNRRREDARQGLLLGSSMSDLLSRSGSAREVLKTRRWGLGASATSGDSFRAVRQLTLVSQTRRTLKTGVSLIPQRASRLPARSPVVRQHLHYDDKRVLHPQVTPTSLGGAGGPSTSKRERNYDRTDYVDSQGRLGMWLAPADDAAVYVPSPLGTRQLRLISSPEAGQRPNLSRLNKLTLRSVSPGGKYTEAAEHFASSATADACIRADTNGERRGSDESTSGADCESQNALTTSSGRRRILLPGYKDGAHQTAPLLRDICYSPLRLRTSTTRSPLQSGKACDCKSHTSDEWEPAEHTLRGLSDDSTIRLNGLCDGSLHTLDHTISTLTALRTSLATARNSVRHTASMSEHRGLVQLPIDKLYTEDTAARVAFLEFQDKMVQLLPALQRCCCASSSTASRTAGDEVTVTGGVISADNVVTQGDEHDHGLRSHENAAAVKIQAILRRYAGTLSFRKGTMPPAAAATRIQGWARGCLQRYKNWSAYERRRVCVSSVVILQSAFRGSIGRKIAAQRKQSYALTETLGSRRRHVAAIRIQSWAIGVQERLQAAESELPSMSAVCRPVTGGTERWESKPYASDAQPERRPPTSKEETLPSSVRSGSTSSSSDVTSSELTDYSDSFSESESEGAADVRDSSRSDTSGSSSQTSHSSRAPATGVRNGSLQLTDTELDDCLVKTSSRKSTGLVSSTDIGGSIRSGGPDEVPDAFVGTIDRAQLPIRGLPGATLIGTATDSLGGHSPKGETRDIQAYERAKVASATRIQALERGRRVRQRFASIDPRLIDTAKTGTRSTTAFNTVEIAQVSSQNDEIEECSASQLCAVRIQAAARGLIARRAIHVVTTERARRECAAATIRATVLRFYRVKFRALPTDGVGSNSDSSDSPSRVTVAGHSHDHYNDARPGSGAAIVRSETVGYLDDLRHRASFHESKPPVGREEVIDAAGFSKLAAARTSPRQLERAPSSSTDAPSHDSDDLHYDAATAVITDFVGDTPGAGVVESSEKLEVTSAASESPRQLRRFSEPASVISEELPISPKSSAAKELENDKATEPEPDAVRSTGVVATELTPIDGPLDS